MKDQPAFPTFPPIDDSHGEPKWGGDGMTLRQWYAGLAMQGMIAGLFSERGQELADPEMKKCGFGEGETEKFVAKVSFDYADAMIKVEAIK